MVEASPVATLERGKERYRIPRHARGRDFRNIAKISFFCTTSPLSPLHLDSNPPFHRKFHRILTSTTILNPCRISFHLAWKPYYSPVFQRIKHRKLIQQGGDFSGETMEKPLLHSTTNKAWHGHQQWTRRLKWEKKKKKSLSVEW